jgi:hypothetical protein
MAAERVKYWPVKYGDRRSARSVAVERGSRPDEAAERAARDYHYNGAGLDAVWPVEIALIYGGMEYRFSVEREAVPEFTAHHISCSQASGGTEQRLSPEVEAKISRECFPDGAEHG